ncbi:MAG: hypothetical protein JNM75_14590 [Rhodospirillales bacterium]|nr:hypothetical protein [Rhodospirillales bacterium]
MQAIKSLVIGLGILIIAGLILLGYAFYARTTDPDFHLMKADKQKAAVRADAPAGEGFGEADLSLPEGCSVVEMRPDGKWLYLRAGPAGPCERIIVIDVATGRTHGVIVRKP